MKFSKPMSEIVRRLNGTTSFHSLTKHDVQNLTSQLERLENLAITKSPKDTDEGHLLKLEEAGNKLLKRQERLWDVVQQRARQEINSRHSEVRNRLNMASTPYASEIRNALRLMTEEERSEAIQKAIAQKDGAFIRALEEAPAMLSGVSPDRQGIVVNQFMSTHEPQLINEVNEIMDGMQTALSALSTAKRAVREGIDPQKLRDIKAAEERYEEAKREFDEAI